MDLEKIDLSINLVIAKRIKTLTLVAVVVKISGIRVLFLVY
tara:strand:+ start:159 stop:281 length:123 start_codon:yes stop_codon:yes gene_type:complete